MTAPNVTPPPTPAPTTPPASTSATPSSGAQDTGFRYQAGPGINEYLVGKTPAEAAEMFNQLVQQNARLQQQGRAPTPTPGYQPPPAPTLTQTVAKPSPEDFITRPAEATEQYAAYLEATRWQPQFQQQATMLAQQAREVVAIKRQDDFKRFGFEIDTAINDLIPDPAMRTPQNINHIVDMVRGRHVEELLADERLKHQNPIGGAAARPDGGGAPGASPQATGTVDLDKLPVNYAATLRRLNLDQRGIDEFLVNTYVKSGMEPTLEKARERWTTQAMRGDVISDGKEFLSGIYT